jgi:Domain of unknown function DUF29
MNKQPQYEEDFYAWALHNAQLMRDGKFQELDSDNIAEEIESLGRREKRVFVNLLALLLVHLLRWQYQPVGRSTSWKQTIKEQRHQLLRLLKESPSLKHNGLERLTEAYEDAIVKAEYEMDFTEFPRTCPFTLEECLDRDFFPD